LETSAEAENKKPSDSGKTGNEGIRRSLEKQFQGPGLILLFVGEAAGFLRPDEHSRDGVLTIRVSSLAPAFPVPWNQWPWEFVTRYSGATVLDFHEVPSVGYEWMV
jgi:hypothetical protein